MSSFVTFALGLLGVVLAGALLRVTLVRGDRPRSWRAVAAVVVVAGVAASGLLNAGDGFRELEDRRDRWAPVSEQEALDSNEAGDLVDRDFTRFVEERLLPGETFYFSPVSDNEPKLWLIYRLAPNLLEDRPEEADWIIYWRQPDVLRVLAVAPEEVVRHDRWSEDSGMLRVQYAR